MKFTFLVVIPTTRASSASCWPRFGRNHIFFVDRVQDSGGRPLDDLVLKGGGYRECALPTVRFGDVNPSGWQGPIRSSMKPCVSESPSQLRNGVGIVHCTRSGIALPISGGARSDDRSQKDRMTWNTIKKLADDFVPPARILHPWPHARFAVRHPR